MTFYWTAWQPYRLSYILCLYMSIFYLPKDHFLKFWWKNVQNWWIWKIDFFWNNKILLYKIQKKKNKFFEIWILEFGCFKKSQFFKSTNSEHFFIKISGNGPWVNRRYSCIGQGCSSTYMVVRLSNKRGKNAFLVFFAFLLDTLTTI